MTYRERKLRRRRSRPLGGVLIGLLALLTVVAIGALAVGGYVLAVAGDTPDIEELEPRDEGATSSIFAADGTRLGFVQSDEIRTPIDSKQMPDRIREATIAIEDENFFEHEGVDFGAIARAGFKNFSSGGTVQGGSTITQQLARALYIEDPERNI